MRGGGLVMRGFVHSAVFLHSEGVSGGVGGPWG